MTDIDVDVAVATVQQIVLLSQVALTIPDDHLRMAISQASRESTLMPLFDPTMAQRHGQSLEDTERMLEAFRTFRSVIADISQAARR